MTTTPKSVPNRVVRHVVLAALCAIFFAGLTWETYTFITVPLPGAKDFYQNWSAAHEYFIGGLDPYSSEVAYQTELGMYGHPYDPDPDHVEPPGNFWYPFSTILLIGPISGLTYAAASAIWMTLIAVGTGVIFWLMADLFHWKMKPLLLGIGIIWALSYYPATRGIFLGQVGIIAVYLQLLTLWCLSKKHDMSAGIILAMSTVKPQLGLLLIPFLMLWAIREKRWRFIMAAAFGFAGITLISFIMLPSWLGEWWQQVSIYNGVTRIEAPLELITHVYIPFLGTSGQWALISALLVLVVWAWYYVLWLRRSEWFNWTIALTLLSTQIVLPRTATPHYVVFFFIFAFYFEQIARHKNGRLIVIGMMLLLNGAQWLLAMATIKENIESLVNYLPLPIALLLLLLLTRPLWLSAARYQSRSLPQIGAISKTVEGR